MAKKPFEIAAKGRGKTFAKSVDAAKKRVHASHDYFIKRGSRGWFRSSARGYTDDIAEAAVFLGSDARGYLSAEGVALVPVSEMRDEIWRQVREALGRSAKLAAMVERY